MHKKLNRLLVYGDIDMNLVDGSSIWLSSLIQVLARSPNNEVHLLLKGPVRRELLLQDLKHLGNVTLIEPFGRFSARIRSGLTIEQAIHKLEHLRADKAFDWTILRGNRLCAEAVGRLRDPHRIIPYVASLTDEHGKIVAEWITAFNQILAKVQVVFLQTEELKAAVLGATGAKRGEVVILPPMVPDFPDRKPEFKNVNNALVYVGKFSRDYFIYESVRAFERLGRKNYHFNIAGDKFHNDLVVSRRRFIATMEASQGVHWFKALRRNEVSELIERSDLGLCWRSSKIDSEHSVELSTKLLEYGRLGKPILLRRIPIHERLLGFDYPFYVNTENELIEKIKLAFDDKRAYESAARRAYSASRAHSFSCISRRIQPVLERDGKNYDAARFRADSPLQND